MRRLLLFLLVLSAPLRADQIPLLLDASYSMALTEGDSTRLEQTISELETYLSRLPRDARLIVFVAEHQSTITLAAESASPEAAVQLAREIVPWGGVDLHGAIRRVRAELDTRGIGAERILVMSDGEDAGFLLDPGPVTQTTGDVTWIGPDGLRPSTAREMTLARAAAPQSAAGGVESGALRPTDTRTDIPAEDASFAEPRPRVLGDAARRWARFARYAFPLAALLGALAALRGYLWHRSRREKVLHHNEKPPWVEVTIRTATGHSSVTIDRYPATVEGLRIDAEGTSLRLHASEPVRVNGIPKTEHPIEERDSVRMGKTRIVFSQIERRRRLRPPRNLTKWYGLAPGFAVAASIVAFLLPITPSTAAGQQQLSAREERLGAGGSVDADLRHLSLPPATPASAPRRILLPGQIPEVDLDFLAIHAHPDDEAIDFGAIVARLTAAGKRGAIVLLTDGGAGRDQYPWRATGTRYPAYDLSASALESVRIEESAESIAHLGVDYYFRLGLQNHPYNTLDEELKPSQVLSIWNRELDAAGVLAELLEITRPEIVLSPDAPGFAREHFEHDATGILVRNALSAVERKGTNPVLAHIRPIDPFQVEGYNDLLTIPAWEPTQHGTVPRLVQLRSLGAHRTQRDATAIGLETRLAIEEDYVRTTLYTEPDAFARWLGQSFLSLFPMDMSGG